MHELRSLWLSDFRSIAALALVVLLGAVAAAPVAAQTSDGESTDTSSTDSDSEETGDDDDGVDEWENDVLKGTATPGTGGGLMETVHALLRSLGLGVERPAADAAGSVHGSRR